jgi:hypothetical protein
MTDGHFRTKLVLSFLTAMIFLGALLVSVPSGKAIPAFSRKYQTSCTTCHNNYPELNDFGLAFKKNGFKFPKDDELFVKEAPVLLGSKATREAFPEAVYPGEIPGSVPISFRYEGNLVWNAKQPQPVQASGYVPRTDLFVPNTFTIISAGSFGPNFSFWIDDDISAGASGANGGLGDAWLKYNDVSRFFHLPTNSINVKFGQFELELPFTNARTPYLSGYEIFGEGALAQGGACGSGVTACQTTNNPFVLGTAQRGIEIGGYPNNGNFIWAVAVVDGTNSAYGLANTLSARNTKDVYLRASQQFNLERDPESRHAIQAAGPTGPRDHTSIRLGAFYYHGNNQQNYGGSLFPTNTFGTISEPFYRVGGDIRFRYRSKFELYGVGLYSHDDNQFVDTVANTIAPARAVTSAGGFVVANYWFYPWLIGTMRYDFVNSPSDFINGVSTDQTRNRFSPGYTILVRANIKIVGEYQCHWGVPYTNVAGLPASYRPSAFVTGIDYVF